ncbi:Trypsin-1 [Halotydeus destructor]|nr:Trypsin-1 [Halotydeus destructor]
MTLGQNRRLICFVILLSILGFFINGAKFERQCGLTFSHELRKAVYGYHGQDIYGGDSAYPGDFPWMTSLQKKSSYEFRYGHFCGAAIIDAHWLLTAAHCFKLIDGKTGLKAVYGTLQWAEKSAAHQFFTKDSVIIHERFKQGKWNDDIALIRLKDPIVFVNETGDINGKRTAVYPLCLPEPEDHFNQGMATVAGWGLSDKSKNKPEPTLQSVMVKILNASDCYNYAKTDQYAITAYQRDTKVCAGYPYGKQDSCTGDSGGPLFQKLGDKAVQMGIVSFGKGCAKPGYPGVYTRVSSYLTWIEFRTGLSFHYR